MIQYKCLSPSKKVQDSSNFIQQLQNLENKINIQLEKLDEAFIEKCLEQKGYSFNVQYALMALNTLFSVDEEELNYTWRQVVNKIKGFEKQFVFCTKQFFNLLKQNKYQPNQIKASKQILAKTKGFSNEATKKNPSQQRDKNFQNFVELIENMLLYIDMIQTQKQQSRIQEQINKMNANHDSTIESLRKEETETPIRRSFRQQASTVDNTLLRREDIGSPFNRNSLRLKDNSVDNTILRKDEIGSPFNRNSQKNKDNSVDNTILVREELGSPINNNSSKNQEDLTDNSILRKDILGSPKNNFNSKTNYFPSAIEEVTENQHVRYTYRPDINLKQDSQEQEQTYHRFSLKRQDSSSNLNFQSKDIDLQSQLVYQGKEKVQVVSILSYQEVQQQSEEVIQPAKQKTQAFKNNQPSKQNQNQLKNQTRGFKSLLREVKNKYKKPEKTSKIQQEKIVNVSQISKLTNSNKQLQTEQIQMETQQSSSNCRSLNTPSQQHVNSPQLEDDISDEEVQLIVPPQSPVFSEESKIKYLQNIIQQEKNDIKQLMTEQIQLKPILSMRAFSPKKNNLSFKLHSPSRFQCKSAERHQVFEREHFSDLNINIYGETETLKYQLYETELDNQYLQQQLQRVLEKLHTKTQKSDKKLQNKTKQQQRKFRIK